MATINYKEAAINEMQDALEIVKAVGRAVHENKTDRESVISNLLTCMNKLEKGLYYIRQK